MLIDVQALQQPETLKKGKVHPCTGTEALYRPYGPQGSRGIALLFLVRGTRRGEGSASCPGRSLPPGKTRYPLYRRLGGPQGRFGQVRKNSPPLGFDPRTVQPVASRYTDYSNRPTTIDITRVKIFWVCPLSCRYVLLHKLVVIALPVDANA